MLQHVYRRRKSQKSSNPPKFTQLEKSTSQSAENKKESDSDSTPSSDSESSMFSRQSQEDLEETEQLKFTADKTSKTPYKAFEIENSGSGEFLVSKSEVPKALRKTYLEHGYRSQFPQATFSQHICSIFQIHTQTLNIWSALLSLILGLIYIYIPWFKRGHHYNPYIRQFTEEFPSTRYSLFLMMMNTGFALCASLFYHWFGDYSLRAYAILNSFDTLLIYSTLFTCISHNIMTFEFLDITTRYSLHVLMMCFSVGTTIYMIHAAIRQVPRIIKEEETKPTLETNSLWYYLLRVAAVFGFGCTTFLFRLSTINTILFFMGNCIGIYCFLTQFPDGILGINVGVGHAIWHCWAFVYIYACFAWLCADIEAAS